MNQYHFLRQKQHIFIQVVKIHGRRHLGKGTLLLKTSKTRVETPCTGKKVPGSYDLTTGKQKSHSFDNYVKYIFLHDSVIFR